MRELTTNWIFLPERVAKWLRERVHVLIAAKEGLRRKRLLNLRRRRNSYGSLSYGFLPLPLLLRRSQQHNLIAHTNAKIAGKHIWGGGGGGDTNTSDRFRLVGGTSFSVHRWVARDWSSLVWRKDWKKLQTFIAMDLLLRKKHFSQVAKVCACVCFLIRVRVCICGEKYKESLSLRSTLRVFVQ